MAGEMCKCLQAESDIAASLTAWGRWQPALAPGRGPSVAEALVGSLGGNGAERRVCKLDCITSPIAISLTLSCPSLKGS